MTGARDKSTQSAQAALQISTAPFVRQGRSTTRIMWEVVIALVPVVVAATWFFGVTAPLLLGSATLGALVTEWAFRPEGAQNIGLRDGSAALTGLLLGLTLPPTLPLWMAFLGGAVGIGLGKLIWGGLGSNVFNPALVGRAFLQSAFPTAMTTWAAPNQGMFDVADSTLAWPLMNADSVNDVVSSATPLGLSKFEGQASATVDLMVGDIAGSLGETSAAVLIACGLWLAVRRIFDWRLLVSTLLGVAAFSTLLYAFGPDKYPTPQFMLLSGGLMFGAVFMVTDPVTSPITVKGAWIFGLGVGLLVVVLRLFGGLPESVMYSILLMNSITPLINRTTQPRRFGGRKKASLLSRLMTAKSSGDAPGLPHTKGNEGVKT